MIKKLQFFNKPQKPQNTPFFEIPPHIGQNDEKFNFVGRLSLGVTQSQKRLGKGFFQFFDPFFDNFGVYL